MDSLEFRADFLPSIFLNLNWLKVRERVFKREP